MVDDFDFSELHNYLLGQAELGAGLDELYLDEPWSLVRKNPVAPARPIIPPPTANRPTVPAAKPAFVPPPQPASFSGNQGSMFAAPAAPAPRPANPSPLMGAGVNAPAPRVAKRTVSPFESANSLDDFYVQIKNEAIYVKEPSVVRYMGPEHPKTLFLLPGVKPGQDPAAFFSTPVGEMLVRLFANLNVDQASIGVSYFYKSTERALSPLLETALKKMLTKELSFLTPEVMVTFGQPLFQQLFGKAKNFENLAGTDLDFSGTRTCALIDPYQMVNDKQMKWLTWKVHIPRSTLFTIKQA